MFDLALRSSLEKITTTSGSGLGNRQWRFATLPIQMGGLGIRSAGDVINYSFLTSRLQISSLQAKILANSDLSSLGSAFERALGAFRALCTSNAFSLNDRSTTSHIMKKLAELILVLLRKALHLLTCSPRDKLKFLVPL